MTGRRGTFDAWVSSIARLVGLALLLAFGVAWIITKQSEPVLIGAALTLYGAGALGRAKSIAEHGPPTPAPVPDTTTGAPRSSE